jgi:hypothetical protein
MVTTVRRDRQTEANPIEPKPVLPIKLFAALGVFFLALTIYIFAAWFLSGDAHAIPGGPTPFPTWWRVSIRVYEGLSSIAALTLLYLLLVKPWLRRGELTLDGLLCVVFIMLFWQDPLSDYFQTAATYNAYSLNLGSWAAQIPGWLAPNGAKLAWPIVWGPPSYLLFFLAGVWAGSAMMRKARARWPRMSNLGLVLICYGMMMIVDLIAETFWVRFGLYVFLGPPWKALTLFSGHYYQFPVYETMFLAIPMTIFACIRHFRNDRGETLAERGVEKLQMSKGRIGAMRFLALLGLFNLIYLCTFNIPMNFFGMRTRTAPADLQHRSYLTTGVCGTGTSYICPGTDVPVPKRGSGHVAPDGSYVRP